MKKSIKVAAAFLSVLTLFSFSKIFCEPASGDYKVSFSYVAGFKSGSGSSGEGVIPYVNVKENKVVLPPFVFSKKFQVNSFEIEDVEITETEEKTLLNCKKFTSNDGKYDITGYELTGTITDGKLEMRVIYKAGKMPFKLIVNYISE